MPTPDVFPIFTKAVGAVGDRIITELEIILDAEPDVEVDQSDVGVTVDSTDVDVTADAETEVEVDIG